MNDDVLTPKNNMEKALEELNYLYKMLKGEGSNKNNLLYKRAESDKNKQYKEDANINFNSVLFLLNKNGEKKKVSLKISFRNGKVGFKVSKNTLKQFEKTKSGTVLTATIPNPEFTEYILAQNQTVIKMVLRDIALTAFLSHDIKKSLNQSQLSKLEWKKIDSYLDKPKIRFPKVGIMFGLYNGFPAWGTVLHAIGHDMSKTRYQTIFIQKLPSQVPKVFFLNQKILSKIHHKYSHNEPCIMQQNKWYEGSTIYTVIGRTIAWITAYEYWKQTGIWPGE